MSSAPDIITLAIGLPRCYFVAMELHRPRASEGNDSTRHEEAAALLVRVADGDEAAFSDLYDRFSGVVFSIAMTMLKEREAAGDALQEIFVAIWERAGKYDPRLGKASSWILTVARNHCCDQLRSSKRKARALRDATEELQARHEILRADQSVDNREDAEQIRAALQELPREQRVAIELAFLRGLTQTEVAATLEEPLGTVKARIRRGMIQLRTCLEKAFAAPMDGA